MPRLTLLWIILFAALAGAIPGLLLQYLGY
jgi:hypothetical protein